MSAFNFGISAESAVRNTRRPLSAWNIHEVEFKGCEIREFDGKKDPTAHYKVLAINFENEDGYFTVTNFFPKDGDDERREYDGKNGGKVIMPSNFETLMAVVKQTAQVLNPTGFEKMHVTAGTYTLYLYDNQDGTLELSTEPMAGKTLVSTGAQSVGQTIVSEKAHKVIIDGQLRIVRGNKIFDATGRQL